MLVKDANGKTAGTGELEAGLLDPSGDIAPIESPCVFIFEVTATGGSEFYAIEVGPAAKTFAADELDHSVTLTFE